MLDHPDTLWGRFLALDQLLEGLASLWTFQPFAHLRLPWEADHPALSRWLRGLDEDAIQGLEADAGALTAALSRHLPWAEEVHTLGLVEDLAPRYPEGVLPRDIAFRVPGRKWQQIRAFAASLPPSPNPYLEWCAGKGHLGRLLGCRDGQRVDSLEVQPQLCGAGAALVRRVGVQQSLHPVDVLTSAADGHLRSAQHAVALHACGELHLRLLRQASRVGVRRLSVSPCCYNLIPSPVYAPLSRAAGSTTLRLEQRHLRLPLQETVTAGRRVRRLRNREVNWRLGLDLLQREVSGVDVYRSLPHFPKTLLNQRFEDFCRHGAAFWELSLPTNLDFHRFEAAGNARRLEVSRMELVRHLFRRPLELWLVLDRALFLQEQGYRVRVGCFCEHRLTPRNLLIDGCLDS